MPYKNLEERKIYHRAYIKKHRTRLNALARSKFRPNQDQVRSRRYYDSISGRAKSLFRSIQKRSILKGIECSIDSSWIESRILSGRCAVTDTEFVLSRHPTCFKNPLAPSVDRLDCSLGYTAENCRLVIESFNAARGEWGDDQLKSLVRSLREWAL